jgi:hypothetical protein
MRSLVYGSGLAALLLLVAPAAAKPDEDTPGEKVRLAIQAGIKYLRDQEAGRGHWENNTIGRVSHPGGQTSLALLALLNAGVPPDDPVGKRGLAFLRTIQPDQTYVVALQTMVFARAGQAADRERIQRNVDWLLAAHGPNGWSYTRKAAAADNSNTQYALLGLHEGLLGGAKVKPEVLKEVRDFYIKTQVDGGWSYRPREVPRMAMTCAGVCGLIITSRALNEQQLRADGSAEQCSVYPEAKPIKDGIRWIGEHFPRRFDKRTFAIMGFPAPFYCLHGLARTGQLTGQRYLGGQDWYRVGCEYLVKIQKTDGSWDGPELGQSLDMGPVVKTSYALLFLLSARAPVLVTKLAHGDGGDWNNKPSDARHLVEFADRELFKKQPHRWQVFDVRQKPVEEETGLRQLVAELQPSPLVYLNGHHLRLSSTEKKLLREYLDNGGFLFAEACCNAELFDRDFKKLMAELFPKDELKPVPKNDPVWEASGKFVVKPAEFPLLGIQKGSRWVVLYSPKALAGYWEANDHERGRGKAAFGLAANVIAYATGK